MSRAEDGIELRAITGGHWQRVVAEHEGQDVSHLSFAPMPVQMGPGTAVSMAGIGGVGTEPEFRRRGLARRVFARSMEEMKEAGYSCVGLYTGTEIVAHRLYRRFGFVDVLVPGVAAKLLDAPGYVQERFAHLVRGFDVAEEVQRWRGRLQVHLAPHPPIFLHIDRGEVRLLQAQPETLDLTLRMGTVTFLQLFRNMVRADYACDAKLLEWEGDEGQWRVLASALEARRQVVKEGGD